MPCQQLFVINLEHSVFVPFKDGCSITVGTPFFIVREEWPKQSQIDFMMYDVSGQRSSRSAMRLSYDLKVT